MEIYSVPARPGRANGHEHMVTQRAVYPLRRKDGWAYDNPWSQQRAAEWGRYLWLGRMWDVGPGGKSSQRRTRELPCRDLEAHPGTTEAGFEHMWKMG